MHVHGGGHSQRGGAWRLAPGWRRRVPRGGKRGEHSLLEATEAALATSELLGDAVVIGVDELDELRVMEALLGLQSADLILELQRRVMPHVHLPREGEGWMLLAVRP